MLFGASAQDSLWLESVQPLARIHEKIAVWGQRTGQSAENLYSLWLESVRLSARFAARIRQRNILLWTSCMSKQWNFKENAETIYMERSPKGPTNYFSHFLKWACFANKLFSYFLEKTCNFTKQFCKTICVFRGRNLGSQNTNCLKQFSKTIFKINGWFLLWKTRKKGNVCKKNGRVTHSGCETPQV